MTDLEPVGINRTALREIKLLQELHHPNIIGVSYQLCFLFPHSYVDLNQEDCSYSYFLNEESYYYYYLDLDLQLLDAFGHKSNISLVFDFMETDLEVSHAFTWNTSLFAVGPLQKLAFEKHFSHTTTHESIPKDKITFCFACLLASKFPFILKVKVPLIVTSQRMGNLWYY